MQGYKIVLWLLQPLMIGYMLFLQMIGYFQPGSLWAKLGLGRGHETPLWIHGASNGELTSMQWVLDYLRERTSRPILITCNSQSGLNLINSWDLPNIYAGLAPFDNAGSVRRFIKKWQPRVLITLENELWPERIAQMAARGPVLCLGARLSEKSAQRWAKFAPTLMRRTLGHISWCSAQDDSSLERLVALGLPADRIAPRMMLKAHLQPVHDGPAPFMLPNIRERTILAASTHEGEEEIILDAFQTVYEAGLFDLLIIAPRHPKRRQKIIAQIAARKLPFAVRSVQEEPDSDTAIYLADSLGEMPRWYQMAGITIIGGTFGNEGGHTPYEPAFFKSAILYGPSTHNFTEIFDLLAQHQAAIAVRKAEDLQPALFACTPAEQMRLHKNAFHVLEHNKTRDSQFLYLLWKQIAQMVE